MILLSTLGGVDRIKRIYKFNFSTSNKSFCKFWCRIRFILNNCSDSNRDTMVKSYRRNLLFLYETLLIVLNLKNNKLYILTLYITNFFYCRVRFRCDIQVHPFIYTLLLFTLYSFSNKTFSISQILPLLVLYTIILVNPFFHSY